MADINLTEQDVDYIGRVVQTEVGPPTSGFAIQNPTEYAAMVGQVVDTITNRMASPSYPSTAEGVINADRQFSAIAGPPAKAGQKQPYGTVDKAPKAKAELQGVVEGHIEGRAMGKPSTIGNRLNYVNPVAAKDWTSMQPGGWAKMMVEGPTAISENIHGIPMGVGDFHHISGTDHGKVPEHDINLDGLFGPLNGYPTNFNTPANVTNSTLSQNMISPAPQQQASSIMPSPEQIAENWGQYQTPVNVTQPQQVQQDIQTGLDKITAMQPGYVENPGLGLSLPSGLDAFDYGIPTMQETMENNRQAWSPAPPSGMPTDIDNSYATTAGNMNIDNTFAGDLTPDAFSQQQQAQAVPSMTDMVEQYGMYTNPAAPAYYDPVDAPMPAVVGPNPQPSFYNTPAIDGIVGARQAIAAQEQDKINKEYEAGRLKAEEEAEKQKVLQGTPSLLGSLGIPGKTKLGGAITGMVSDIFSGSPFGGRSSMSAEGIADIVGNAINESGLGFLTGQRPDYDASNPNKGKTRTSSPYAGGPSITGGPSANFSGYDAVTNDYGVTTVSNDNMSFTDNSDGASADGGATVLCTHYFNKGWLSSDVYAADILFGATMPGSVMAFYHWWAKPLVKQLEKHSWLEKAIWPVVRLWANSMYKKAGKWHKTA